MEFRPTSIAGAFEIHHNLFADSRGRFMRQYCEDEFAAAGLDTGWAQVNRSVTFGAGSLRGLHFQYPPQAEDKLVSCMVGSAFDVALDLRKGSPTFLQWASVEIGEARSF